MSRGSQEFIWTALHKKCFESLKDVVCGRLVLKTMNADSKKAIWDVCDASVAGIGAYYGEGEDWRTMRPAGFHSRKFSPAQMNYTTFEQELLAVIEALMKWEDKLVGRPFTVATDHCALEHFSTLSDLSRRLSRWMMFLQRFTFTIVHVEGQLNIASDALSRYHESDTSSDVFSCDRFVNANDRLDPKGEDATQVFAIDRPARKRKPTKKARQAPEKAARAKSSALKSPSEGPENRVYLESLELRDPAAARPKPSPRDVVAKQKTTLAVEHGTAVEEADKLTSPAQRFTLRAPDLGDSC